jgi:hypothetical protein
VGKGEERMGGVGLGEIGVKYKPLEDVAVRCRRSWVVAWLMREGITD